ncbi:MAG: hypothetical protein IJS60_04780 [Abditibacteriota bacterium]|nr:hypothetical protein [Abditibacteriota bacterium]
MDNPYISKEYIERQRENISQISFETEYEAKFCDNVSNVFKTDSIKEAVEKDMSVEGCVVIGVDFARYKDWTVACVLRSDGERCEMLKQLRFNKVSWKAEIDNILNLVYEFKPIKLICDATGVGDPLCENLERLLIEENSPCEVVRFKFTNESKNIIVDYVNLLLDTGRISLLEDPVLIKEMENFEYSLTETGSVKLEAKYNFHDDTVCALALACHGSKGFESPRGIYAFP